MLAVACGALGGCVVAPYDGYAPGYGAPYPYSTPPAPRYEAPRYETPRYEAPRYEAPRDDAPPSYLPYGAPGYDRRDDPRRGDGPPVFEVPDLSRYGIPPAYTPEYGRRDGEPGVPLPDEGPPAGRWDTPQPGYQPGLPPPVPRSEPLPDLPPSGAPGLGPPTWR
ncbi:hypothetical protein [Muricoccus radiodurans]|uniref:hypothetical protein n=1 Tax=Muricoccus radiodurans TaxID=2231721 RepID=UPI003CF33E79